MSLKRNGVGSPNVFWIFILIIFVLGSILCFIVMDTTHPSTIHQESSQFFTQKSHQIFKLIQYINANNISHENSSIINKMLELQNSKSNIISSSHNINIQHQSPIPNNINHNTNANTKTRKTNPFGKPNSQNPNPTNINPNTNTANTQKYKHKRHNIVFILTDDQDLVLNTMPIMNKTEKVLFSKSLKFTNAFVNSPCCCVSRASILTGRYVHNTKSYGNNLPGGCGDRYWIENMEPLSFGKILNDYGYTTFYGGKYKNVYPGNTRWDLCQDITSPLYNKTVINGAGRVCDVIPVGWDQWYGLHGNSLYYGYNIQDNHVTKHHGREYETDYLTDNIKRRALRFLRNELGKKEKKTADNDGNFNYDYDPFLMVIAPPAPHDPFTPAPQYQGTVPMTVKAPRTGKSWGWSVEGNENKHGLLRKVKKGPMTENEVNLVDMIYRSRIEVMYSVDDLVSDVYNEISKMGLIDDTYFVYFSDHGFHLGQFGLLYDKRQLFDTDLRVPMTISGPGIEKGGINDMIVTSVDLAPTIIELAMGDKEYVPHEMDGMSLVPYIKKEDGEREREELVSPPKQQQFYVYVALYAFIAHVVAVLQLSFTIILFASGFFVCAFLLFLVFLFCFRITLME